MLLCSNACVAAVVSEIILTAVEMLCSHLALAGSEGHEMHGKAIDHQGSLRRAASGVIRPRRFCLQLICFQ
jgi:hypothetical protein